MIVWEYRSYTFEPREKLLPKLNEMGADGWEAFNFVTDGERGTRVLFKRQSVKATPTGDEPK